MSYRVFSPREAAKFLGLDRENSKNTVLNMIKKGELKASKRNSRVFFIKEQELIRFLDERESAINTKRLYD